MTGKSTKLSKITGRYLWIGVGLAGLFWIFESCVHVFAFNDAHFIHQMLAPEPHELWMRLIIVVLFVVFGIHAQQIIIQRMGAKDAMRESEQKYRTLFEGAAEGIGVVDIKTKEFKYANPALCKMLGYSEDELVQLSVPDIHPQETLDHVISEFEAQARGEKTLATCIPCLRKDGTIIYADINTTKISIDGRECNVGFFTDVTERKKIEDALRESEERYSLLINKTPSVTWITDEHGKTTFISPNVERVYGYNQQEVYEAGDSVWFGRIHPDDVELVRESFEMMLTKNQEYDVEYRIQRKDGAWIWLHDMAIMAFEKDNIRYVFGVFSDITERKRAEESLQASESRYRTLVENLPVKVFVKDKDSVYVSCNESYALDLGIKPDEIAGRTDYDYYPEDLAEKYRSDDRRAMGSGQTEELEERYIRDGQELYVHTIKTSLKNEVGNVTGVLGVFWDITERKRVEDALRESEQRFRELAELLPVSVFELDLDGNFTYSNRCGFEMFGYTREDLEKGMNALQLFIPEERQRIKQNIRKRLTGGEFEDHEYTALKKDGSTLTVLIITAAIIRDNKSIGVRGIVVDITERKQAEEALRQERDRAQQYLDIAGVMFVAIDRDGKITLINRRGSEVLAVKPEQVIGNNWFDHFIPERMRDDIRTVFQRLMHGEVEPLVYYENSVLRSNGEEKIIAWHNTILKNEAGGIVGTLSSGEDITDRKRAEEELKKSSEQLRHLSTYLQSAREEERTSIAREIHDDLGQALTALKMDLHWLSNKLPRDQELLLNKTKSMSSLIDMTVKSVQRISSELRPGLLDDLGLSAAIEWQVGEFENRTGIKCNVAIDPEEIVLDRDPSTAIFRIFQESLTNIVRHANATMVDITLEEKSDTLELKVRDNGKGITEEQISDPRSFGLIGMRERVYSLGGYLSISGTPNEGTTIMVGIPFNKEE